VYSWVDKGYYRVGETVQASFNAQTLDQKGVKGKGVLSLMRVTYDKNNKPVESEVQKWDLDTGEDGRAELQLKASQAGQYRLSYKVTDARDHTIEGGYVFLVRGEGFDGREFRFNHIEIVTDKKEYAPGEKVRVMINTDKAGSSVLLFLRPSNGAYLRPEIINLVGKSVVHEIEISKKDMPNFFVEAVTVADGQVHQETREIIVPPEKRVLNVEVLPDSAEYKPGAKAKVKVKLTDFFGKPFVGSTVMTVYDKSVEYISGGSNVPAIRDFFWKWRRSHHPSIQHSLQRWFGEILKNNETGMSNLGVFGHLTADSFEGAELEDVEMEMEGNARGVMGAVKMRRMMPMAKSEMACDAAAPAVEEAKNELREMKTKFSIKIGGAVEMNAPEVAPGEPALAATTVRKNFADTAFWKAVLSTDENGVAEVEFDMPEQLTGWKVKVWAMGHGTKVGQGEAGVVTRKNLMLRMQAPRFFVQKDEVVLSANIHNYLKGDKDVTAILELDGTAVIPVEGVVVLKAGKDIKAGQVQALLDELKNAGVKDVRIETVEGTTLSFAATRKIAVKANGEERVDWRVRVLNEGEAVLRMKALTDEESDAMEMRFPSFVHGMMKQVPKCGVIRPEGDGAKIVFNVPAERRINESKLELRYSPTLAMAMVDALPYLVEYPYGCTEQTLNKFIPTVVTQKILIDMGVKLEDIKNKRSNLNAQEIGDDVERAKQWKKNRTTTHDEYGNLVDYNPVFDEDKVQSMVKVGVKHLANMQLSDGGWGWFSGYGESSYPHTTATVIHGLQVTRKNNIAIVPGVIARGVEWLKRYQAEQIFRLENALKDPKVRPWKSSADDLDAMVYMVLVDEKVDNVKMRDFLYRDRNRLSVYAKCMFGMALHNVGDVEKRDMVIRNVEQFVVKDKENQTAYLKLGNEGYWWYWYGSEYEAHAYFLKLLSLVKPKDETASWLVKYLLNNRKHATYWNSTRDTALVLEAFADYIHATGEDEPDMTVEILVNGKKMKEVKINKDNLFTYDNKFELVGDAVGTGEQVVEIRKTGKGPLYFNAYMNYFTLEDYITKAGLEIKVERKYYKLEREDKTIKAEGSRGQAVDQKIEKYRRVPIKDLDVLKSGDLVEIELEIASKNDYEYIIFEDMKPAGFEPVEVRSGYNGNDMGAYVEFRDEKVAFFIRALARGNHSVSYRMRAEIPGKFSALPTRAYAMYAPELKANSDEIKLKVEDAEE
ncbi:MAG: alpha-2-macroglobulin, partial [Planctomycetes bacterium]|nr:alpha-2-macroglobulin [Planctomycetota bacterium]